MAPSAPTNPWLEQKHGDELHSFNMYLFWYQSDGPVGDTLDEEYKLHSLPLSYKAFFRGGGAM